MAANPECIPSLIEGLGNYMKLVLTLTDQADTPVIEAAITQLFGQCIQVMYIQTVALISWQWLWLTVA